MTTLTIMKARIADELARSDLTSQIAYSITDAIERYQPERFWFNESRDVTFNTAAAQEFYTSSDNALIPDIYAIDYVSMVVGGTVNFLERYTPDVIEDLSNNATSNGEPYAYSYFQKKIRLYPIPTGANAVRVVGHVKVAAPATDGEASNAWMTDAERLIRARAKLNLAMDVLHDGDLAAAMHPMVDDAFDQLKGRTNRLLGTGTIRPSAF